jgi:thiamine biosynthesis lipoprotein
VGYCGVVRRRFHHHPLLGTVVDVVVETGSAAVADAVDRAAVAEIVRLQAVFDVHDPTSELSRWRRGEEEHPPSRELTEVLALALEWQHRSDGRFNPLSGLLSHRWRSAEVDGVAPTTDELADLARSVAEPRYDLIDGLPRRRGDCSALDLNALAKGWIVDRALGAAWDDRAAAVTISAGGDVAHQGRPPARVAIENPLRPYDNEPPLTMVDLEQGGLATSGRSRRGFRVGDRWYGHVIDPRTGATVDHTASISVIAGDAATADAVATVAGVLRPEEAVELLDSLVGVGGLVVDPAGVERCDRTWLALAHTTS